ncbi:hypothetical protein FGRMN_2941 [Fusarium graminum]|nr:hypothetical protein FGRMN_2941 [Fusarium graminum]
MNELTGLRLMAEGDYLTDRGVDIITIHGLGGYDSWKHPKDESIDGSRQYCGASMHTTCQDVPIRIPPNLSVFIGGLILQSVLTSAFNHKDDKQLLEIISATRGIIFLGTPHSSSLPELSNSVSNIASASKTIDVTMNAVKLMEKILVAFATLPQQSIPWKVVYCYEELPLPGTDIQDLCQFTTQQDPSYVKVVQSVRNIISVSSGFVPDGVTVKATLSPIENGKNSSATNDAVTNRDTEVLESLQTEDVSANIHDASNGTCNWILHHDDYKSWSELYSKPLWITGISGSGKSTLMKHMIDHQQRKRTSGQAVVYYFFRRGTNQSVTSLLSSLLFQLLSMTPPMRTFGIFSRFIEKRENDGPETIWDHYILKESLIDLLDTLTASGDSIFIFVDGLDECDDPGTIIALFHRLHAFNPSRRIRICASSRLSDLPMTVIRIRMEENNSPDIRKYVCHRLLGWVGHLPPKLDIESFTQRVTEKAQGMFLWASLMVSHLTCESYLTASKDEQNLSSWLPATLEAAYKTILRGLWSRHDRSRRELANDALILVLCAQRPLSVLELQSALAVLHSDIALVAPTTMLGTPQIYGWDGLHKRPVKATLDMSAQLMILCGGLLQVTPWSPKSANNAESAAGSRVHFVHQTAKAYLLEEVWCTLGGTPKRFKCQIEDAPKIYMPSTTCGPAGYACSGQKGLTPITEDMFQFDPFQMRFIERWISSHDQMFKERRLFQLHKTKAVHIMSYYGLPWHTTGLWGAKVADINEEDHCGRTPLSFAAALGYTDICELLLDEGADSNHRDHVHGQTPLSYAAAHGHRGVVQLLLERGSDFDDIDSGVTPLWLAVRSGHLEVAKLLLKVGANPNATNIHTGEACLSLAAALGHVKATSLLLEHGAEVDTWDKIGWTPIHHAVSRGRKKTIELLLGALKLTQLQKLKASFSGGSSSGSWLTTVLRSIILWVCYQRGSESPEPPAGNQNTRLLCSTADRRVHKKPRHNGHKRKLDGDSDEDDGKEDEGGIPGKKPRRSNLSGRRFACPYFKRNETKFSRGACNKTGFQDIYRLRSHLGTHHNRATGWRRCHTCQRRFPRDKIKDHTPCEQQENPTDYEDGYDQDQAEDLQRKNIRLSESSDEVCWIRIFRVLFPDWPQNKDVPSPYQETQSQVVSTQYLQAAQRYHDQVTAPETISRIRSSQSNEEAREILTQLIESHFGVTPTTTSSLLHAPMSTVPLQQLTVGPRNLNPFPLIHSVEQPPSGRNNGYYHHERQTAFSNPTSDTNSSYVFPGIGSADPCTDDTGFSEDMSASIDFSWLYQSVDSGRSLWQPAQEILPTFVQQPADTVNQSLGPSFAPSERMINPTDTVPGPSLDPQYPSSHTWKGLDRISPEALGHEGEQGHDLDS